MEAMEEAARAEARAAGWVAAARVEGEAVGAVEAEEEDSLARARRPHVRREGEGGLVRRCLSWELSRLTALQRWGPSQMRHAGMKLGTQACITLYHGLEAAPGFPTPGTVEVSGSDTGPCDRCTIYSLRTVRPLYNILSLHPHKTSCPCKLPLLRVRQGVTRRRGGRRRAPRLRRQRGDATRRVTALR